MERLEVIETLKHLPDQLERELAGLSEAVLRQRPAAAEWSLKEVCGHLRDHVEITQRRLFMVWSMTDPVLPGYDGDELVSLHDYQEADLRGIIEGLRQKRLETVALLSHAVDWTRIGQLPGIGRRSLKQITVRAINHEAVHLAQIQATRSAAGQTVP